MMTTTATQTKRESVSERFPPFDDSVSLRLTPTPSGNYRCPVSTPANFVQCAGKVRRTKPLHDVIRPTQVQPQPTTNGRVKVHRSKLTALSRANKHQRSMPRTGRGIDYYFVDPSENRREEEATNGHWLRALCAQPVDEILGKYRRRTDLHRAQLSLVRSCSTPGERSLVNAWEKSSLQSSNFSGRAVDRGGVPRKQTVKSAVTSKHHKAFGGRSASSTLANSPDRRTTNSEPPLSRVQQNAESVERYGLSPRTPAVHGGQRVTGRGREGSNREKLVDEKGHLIAFPDERPHQVKGFLLDQASGDEDDKGDKPTQPRYVSFTTQLFKQSDDRGNTTLYHKISRGPEHLPYISNSKRVISMVHNTNVYSCKVLSGSSGTDSSPGDSTPILDKSEESNKGQNIPTQENSISPLQDNPLLDNQQKSKAILDNIEQDKATSDKPSQENNSAVSNNSVPNDDTVFNSSLVEKEKKSDAAL